MLESIDDYISEEKFWQVILFSNHTQIIHSYPLFG